MIYKLILTGFSNESEDWWNIIVELMRENCWEKICHSKADIVPQTEYLLLTFFIDC